MQSNGEGLDGVQRWLLGLGLAGIGLVLACQQWAGLSPAGLRALDDAQWTLGFILGTAVACRGWRKAPVALKAARAAFALGLAAFTAGQLEWDLQAALGWSLFPSPADLGFMLLPLGLSLGYARSVGDWNGSDRVAVGLDILGASLTVLAFGLLIYLSGGPRPMAVTLSLVLYAVLWGGALVTLTLVAISRRWRMDRELAWMLASLGAMVGLGLAYSFLRLNRVPTDGRPWNAGYSLAGLGLGAAAALWSPRVLVGVEAERRRLWMKGSVPVALAVCAGLSLALAMDLPAPANAWVAGAGALSLLVVVARQTRSLAGSERRLRMEAQYAKLLEERASAQRLEALGTLAGGVAHDFNNLLALMLIEAEAVRARSSGQDAKDLDRLMDVCRRGRDLVRRIQAFARPGEGWDPQALDPAVALRDVVQLLRPLLSRQVEMLVVAPPGLPDVWCDPAQLQQVLMNLGINAGQAIGDAPGRITFQARLCGTLLGEAAGRIEISVLDSGEGMPLAIQQRIFEPFFTTKAPGQGSGLGLAVAQSIIQHAGGSLTCRSAPGEGACFTVTLMTAPQERAMSPFEPMLPLEPRPGAPARRHQGQVLVVDDEGDLARGMAALLSRRGVPALAVASPTEALALVRGDPARWAVVLTDMTMPDMNGRELRRHLRAVDPSLPVVLMSGLEDEAEPGEFEGRLVKPFRVDELLPVLKPFLPG